MRSVLKSSTYEAEGEIDASLGLNKRAGRVLRDYLETPAFVISPAAHGKSGVGDLPVPAARALCFLHTLRGGR
jgi:hypothetical protein